MQNWSSILTCGPRFVSSSWMRSRRSLRGRAGHLLQKSRLIEVLLLACCDEMLILMSSEIKRKLAWIGWIGTEALTSYRTGILAGPYTFARPVCHYRPEAAFFGWH